MPDQATLSGVQSDRVGEVVQSFIKDGATNVSVSATNNGTFDITAYFSPSA